MRYGFVRSGSHASQLSEILFSFTNVCDDLGKRTSLVVFFESWDADERSHGSYYQAFFELLAETSKHDTQPWPREHAVDTDHPSPGAVRFADGDDRDEVLMLLAPL